MASPSYKENERLNYGEGESEEKIRRKSRQRVYSESGQITGCRSASHKWMTMVIKND